MDESGRCGTVRGRGRHLEHNELESIETNGFVQIHPFGNPFQPVLCQRIFAITAAGVRARSSSLRDGGSRTSYLRRVAASSFPALVGQLGYQRDYVETGDGKDFDVFERYSRNPGLPETTTDGLYWLGDNPDTPLDEGRQFDYYYRSLLTVLSVRAESRIAWGASALDPTQEADGQREGIVEAKSGATRSTSTWPLRIGAEFEIPRWRVFEHLAPSQAVTGAESGYQMTRNFGYVGRR
jgi:hypothetical protein